MAVEATQLDDLAVQFKAMVGEPGLAKTEVTGVLVEQLCSAAQANAGGVEVAIFHAPQLDSAKIFKMHGVRNRIAGSARSGHRL